MAEDGEPKGKEYVLEADAELRFEVENKNENVILTVTHS